MASFCALVTAVPAVPADSGGLFPHIRLAQHQSRTKWVGGNVFCLQDKEATIFLVPGSLPISLPLWDQLPTLVFEPVIQQSHEETKT